LILLKATAQACAVLEVYMSSQNEQNALAAASAAINGDGLIQVGRAQAFSLYSAFSAAAFAEEAVELKRKEVHKDFGLTWDQFCQQHLKMNRATVDRYIHDHKELGRSYFQMNEACGVGRASYRLIAGEVEEGSLVIDGERVPITRDNRERIIEFVEQRRLEALEAKREAENAERRAASAKEKQKALEAQLDTAREALRPAPFVPTDELHDRMIKLQGEFDRFCVQLKNTGSKLDDYSPDNQGRLLGLVSYMGVQIIETIQSIREQYGKGYTAPNMDDDRIAELEFKPDARNLMHEELLRVRANKPQ
jgi:hypothetical protein